MIDSLIDVLDWVDDTTADTVLSALVILVAVGYLLIEANFLWDRFLQKRGK